jgi:hypothetical protein
MGLSDPLAATALLAALLLLPLLIWRRRQARTTTRADPRREALDTVQAWPPEAARVLTVDERQAYDLLRQALPGFLVLAQVPLSRFLRVPTRHSYSEWMQRVGGLSADLLVCDAGSRVLAVIDIRPVDQTERSRRRHERMVRVLEAAGILVQTWREGKLPSVSDVRQLIGVELQRRVGTPAGAAAATGAAVATAAATAAAAARPATPPRAMPLIPVADIEEMLADGDQAYDAAIEPVPSAFFDDMELAPRARGAGG